MIQTSYVGLFLKTVRWFSAPRPGMTFRHECPAGRADLGRPIPAHEGVAANSSAAAHAVDASAMPVAATRPWVTTLGFVVGLFLWATCQSTWARKFAPPPLTLADKMASSDLIVTARVLGIVCIVPLEEGLRETAACNIHNGERKYVRLLVESTICKRDTLPVAQIVYRGVWFDIVDPDRPKIPYGARYVVYLKRSFLSGPFVSDRFHAPIKGDTAVPDPVETEALITAPMLKGCTN